MPKLQNPVDDVDESSLDAGSSADGGGPPRSGGSALENSSTRHDRRVLREYDEPGLLR